MIHFLKEGVGASINELTPSEDDLPWSDVKIHPSKKIRPPKKDKEKKIQPVGIYWSWTVVDALS